jgi:di/tricarboxylate transporter
MSLLGGNDLKEQQKINDLELKINREKQKLDKKLTRQKILLGAFLLDALEKDAVDSLKEYTANNLLDFLTGQGDKDLMKGFIEVLGGVMSLEDDSG